MFQILGCNTIKAVNPFFQSAMITVHVLNMIHTFHTLFPVGLKAVMN